MSLIARGGVCCHRLVEVQFVFQGKGVVNLTSVVSIIPCLQELRVMRLLVAPIRA